MDTALREAVWTNCTGLTMAEVTGNPVVTFVVPFPKRSTFSSPTNGKLSDRCMLYRRIISSIPYSRRQTWGTTWTTRTAVDVVPHWMSHYHSIWIHANPLGFIEHDSQLARRHGGFRIVDGLHCHSQYRIWDHVQDDPASILKRRCEGNRSSKAVDGISPRHQDSVCLSWVNYVDVYRRSFWPPTVDRLECTVVVGDGSFVESRQQHRSFIGIKPRLVFRGIVFLAAGITISRSEFHNCSVRNFSGSGYCYLIRIFIGNLVYRDRL